MTDNGRKIKMHKWRQKNNNTRKSPKTLYVDGVLITTIKAGNRIIYYLNVYAADITKGK